MNELTPKGILELIPFRYKIMLILLIIVLFILLLISGYSAISNYFEIRQYEKVNSDLQKKNDVLELQKKDYQKTLETISAQIKTKEAAIETLDKKAKEKLDSYEKAKANTDDARTEYNDAVNNPRTDNPDRETVCAELAKLNYPCE